MTAAVLGQVDRDDLRVSGRVCPEYIHEAVRGAVVHGNDLIIESRLLADNFPELINDQADRTFAGVAGNNKTDQFLLFVQWFSPS